MKSLFSDISDWVDKDRPFAIARVIKTWGSSPRPIGSALIISEQTEMQGSVSGGCVEGTVVRAALPLITEKKSKLISFGVSDEDAWAVGLSCGGKIDVFIEPFMAFSDNKKEKTVWREWKKCLSFNQACILVSRLRDGDGFHTLVLPDGTLHGQKIPETLKSEALRAYKERKNQVVDYNGVPYFIHLFPRRSQILIIGAAHITTQLVSLARMYDFQTIVIDPRGFFVKGTQFPTPPHQILEAYPEEVLENFKLDAYTYAVILSHDPKIDDNALNILLRSDIAYIGALGSRRTHAKRIKRLEEAGFREEEIARIHAPVGLDINAKSPQEIALSVMGEIIKVKNQYL